MVTFAEVPGVEIQFLKDHQAKQEYTLDPSLDDDDEEDDEDVPWPKKIRYLEAQNGEAIHIRVSFFSNFTHLSACHAMKIDVDADGEDLFTTHPRTEFMRKKLYGEFRRSFDHNMNAMIRFEDGQRKTKQPRFTQLEVDDDHHGRARRDMGTIRIRVYRVDWVKHRVNHRPPRNSTDNTKIPSHGYPKNRKQSWKGKKMNREVAQARRLSHALKLTDRDTTNQRASHKVSVHAKQKDPKQVFDKDTKYSWQWVDWYRPLHGRRKGKPLFEAVYRYRSWDKLQELGVSMPPSDSSGGENSPQTHSVSNGPSGSSRSDRLDRSGGPSGSSTENIFVTGESSSITDESLATTVSSNSRRSPSLNSETRSHRSSSSSSSSGSVINLASILGANERELDLVG